MARAAAVNALSEQTLDAGVLAGGNTLIMSASPGSAMPFGSGVFALIITEGTVADTEVVEVTRTLVTDASVTLSGMTFAKAHNAGATIKYVQSALDFNNFARLDAANQFLGGSASAVSIRFGSTAGTGFFGTTASVSVAISGVTRVVFNVTGMNVTGSISPTGSVNSGLGDSGAHIVAGSTATPQQIIEITDANAVVEIVQSAFGSTSGPIIRVRDPQGIWTGGHIEAKTGSPYNSINESDLVNGVWDDGLGWVGPGGATYPVTAGHEYEIIKLRNDPGISFGVGGWTVKDLGPCF